jgi:NADPH-dependent 2,4-dienoyl-CoA reductase/sulfur reductase-like enzyme
MGAPIVVVGGSLAGVRVVQGLRTEGCDDPIVLIDEQDESPYDKPPLSKQVLVSGEADARIRLLTDTDATELAVELRLGTGAASLDQGRKVVVLRDGSTQPYSRLVLATGGHAMASPWGNGDGIFTLRTLDEARRLSRSLRELSTLTVVGAGLIGTEVASAGVAHGVQVTLVDAAPGPLSRVVSDDVSRWLADWYRSHGLALRFGAKVEAIDAHDRCHRVRLASGETLESDCVVVAIGSRPSVAWLAGAGLTVEDGVLCSDGGAAVGAPDVYAVGDVARWWDAELGVHVRHEHWTRATEQAACVAHNIAHPGADRTVSSPSYAWSDQFGSKLQVVGRRIERTTRLVPGARPDQWAALYASGDRLVGAAVLNWPKALAAARRSLETTHEIPTL